MSFTVTLYDFQKRHNSTRRPQGGSWDQTGVLREGSSLITPTISFEFATDFSPMNNSYNMKFNYAYVAKFARYYWITDWTYEGGLWHAAMKVDVLATYRPQILAADAFVAYDAVTPNADLSDQRLSMLTQKTIDSATGFFSKLGQNDPGGGVVIVMCTGADSTAAFAMTPSDIVQLMNNVSAWGQNTLGNPPMPQSSNVAEAIFNGFKSFFDWLVRAAINLGSVGSASANIRAAVQLPIDISDIPGTNQEIVLGLYRTGVYAKKVSSRVLYDSCQISIPWRYTDWRANEPYTEIYLFIPYVGNIKMSNRDIYGETDLRIYASLDVLSGDVVFRVYAEPSDKVIALYTANIGASYPIGVSNISPGQIITSLTGAAGILSEASNIGGSEGAALGALGAVHGIINAGSPNSSSIGGGGGGASQGITGTCYIVVICHNTNQEPDNPDYVAIMGTPTMLVKPLANLTGYVETRGAAITGNMTATEHAELNALLDSGVYIETGG